METKWATFHWRVYFGKLVASSKDFETVPWVSSFSSPQKISHQKNPTKKHQSHTALSPRRFFLCKARILVTAAMQMVVWALASDSSVPSDPPDMTGFRLKLSTGSGVGSRKSGWISFLILRKNPWKPHLFRELFWGAGFLPIVQIFFLLTVGVLSLVHIYCRGGRGSIFIPPKHPGSLVSESYPKKKWL